MFVTCKMQLPKNYMQISSVANAEIDHLKLECLGGGSLQILIQKFKILQEFTVHVLLGIFLAILHRRLFPG